MAHTYDLLLQARTPGEVAPVAALVKVLSERGATLTPEGRGAWKLSDGEVTVEPLLEEGLVKGLDLRIPLLDRTGLLEDVVKQLVEVAERAEARLTDPQRGDVVALSTLSMVLEEYLRMARYAGEYGAVSGALGLSTWAAPPEEDSSALRWVLLIVVFVIAAWAGWRTINTIRDANRADEAPAAVDGTSKIPGQ